MLEFCNTPAGKRYIVLNNYNQILLITSDRLYAERINHVLEELKDHRGFKIGVWSEDKLT